MQPLLEPRWAEDFTGPYPSVAQLWPTAHDWFAEADTRDELTVSLDNAFRSPTAAQVKKAWNLARSHGATPLMNVYVTPTPPWRRAFTIEVEAFYVAGAPLEACLIEQLEQILGESDEPGNALLYSDGRQALEYAGKPPVEGADLRAWEWF